MEIKLENAGSRKVKITRDAEGNITHRSSRIFLKNLKAGDVVLTPAGERFLGIVESVKPTKWWLTMSDWDADMPVAEYTITWENDKESTVHKAINGNRQPSKVTVLRSVVN